MLTITRGLSWVVNHTVMDNYDGPLSDLTDYIIKSQIREKTAIDQEYPLVIDVTVIMSGVTDSYMKLSLTKEETMALKLGDYLIDVVGTKNGVDEFILNKEAIKVVGYVTLPEDPGDVPNFVEIFEEALND